MPTTYKQNPMYVENQSDAPVPVTIVSGSGGASNYALENGGELNVIANNTTKFNLIKALDVTVTTSAALNVDSIIREEITLLADVNNTDTIKIGSSGAVYFPLVAGSMLTLRKTSLNLVFAVANSGSQILHIICGGF